MESTQLVDDRGHLESLLAVGDEGRAAEAPPERSGATVHLLTWRLLDYDGAELTYGGQQRWQLQLARLLRMSGHDVVVHQRAHRDFDRQLTERVRVRGHACATNATGALAFNRMAHRAIPKHAPVVYMVEDLAFPRCRARSAVVQHGVWWDGEYGWTKTRMAEWIARRAVQRTAATICVDTNFINWLRARWPESGLDDRLHYVPNFLDQAQWGPQPDRPAAEIAADAEIQICFPRRSEPRRGMWLMAEVAPRLAESFPQVRFRFAVGSGHETENLRQRLAISGIGTHRWSIEVVPFERMRELYESSAIVTVPTVCGEGTSLAAIEAMYFGCAVVSTWVGGLPNLIRDGHNGTLIPPTAAALEAALARLITDGDLRARLGRTAMAEVPEVYGIERWQKRVGSVLERALAVPVAV